jgi:hypothetical protein
MRLLQLGGLQKTLSKKLSLLPLSFVIESHDGPYLLSQQAYATNRGAVVSRLSLMFYACCHSQCTSQLLSTIHKRGLETHTVIFVRQQQEGPNTVKAVHVQTHLSTP